jgi:hypothetical protein
MQRNRLKFKPAAGDLLLASRILESRLGMAAGRRRSTPINAVWILLVTLLMAVVAAFAKFVF